MMQDEDEMILRQDLGFRAPRNRLIGPNQNQNQNQNEDIADALHTPKSHGSVTY